jgi:hypothetical protein
MADGIDGLRDMLGVGLMSGYTPTMASGKALQAGMAARGVRFRRGVGEVWREGRVWYVKLPGGIHTTTTKREAAAFAAAI